MADSMAAIMVGIVTIMAKDVSNKLCRLRKFLFCETITIVNSKVAAESKKTILALAAELLF